VSIHKPIALIAERSVPLDEAKRREIMCLILACKSFQPSVIGKIANHLCSLVRVMIICSFQMLVINHFIYAIMRSPRK
jgi:hypothetical protein